MWQWLLSDEWKLCRIEICLSTFRSAEQQKSCKILCGLSAPAKSQEIFGCSNSNWESKSGSPAVAGSAYTVCSCFEFLLFVPYISTAAGIVSSVRRLTDTKLKRMSMQLFGCDFVTCFLDVSGHGTQSNFPVVLHRCHPVDSLWWARGRCSLTHHPQQPYRNRADAEMFDCLMLSQSAISRFCSLDWWCCIHILPRSHKARRSSEYVACQPAICLYWHFTIDLSSDVFSLGNSNLFLFVIAH